MPEGQFPCPESCGLQLLVMSRVTGTPFQLLFTKTTRHVTPSNCELCPLSWYSFNTCSNNLFTLTQSVFARSAVLLEPTASCILDQRCKTRYTALQTRKTARFFTAINIGYKNKESVFLIRHNKRIRRTCIQNAVDLAYINKFYTSHMELSQEVWGRGGGDVLSLLYSRFE